MIGKVKLTVAFICVVLSTVVLYGCATQPSDYEVEEVRCVYNYGDMDKAELDVFTSDGAVKWYIVSPYSDSGINLFKGEIPSDDKCVIEEFTISPDEWNTITETIKNSDFMNLPEELPEVEAYDGSTCYIEVVTSIGEHRSGGYCAGNGSGKKHEQFYSVKRTLTDLVKKTGSY